MPTTSYHSSPATLSSSPPTMRMRWPIGLRPPSTWRANDSFTISTRPVSKSSGSKSRPATTDVPKAAKKPPETCTSVLVRRPVAGAPVVVSTSIPYLNWSMTGSRSANATCSTPGSSRSRRSSSSKPRRARAANAAGSVPWSSRSMSTLAVRYRSAPIPSALCRKRFDSNTPPAASGRNATVIATCTTITAGPEAAEPEPGARRALAAKRILHVEPGDPQRRQDPDDRGAEQREQRRVQHRPPRQAVVDPERHGVAAGEHAQPHAQRELRERPARASPRRRQAPAPRRTAA